LELISTGKFFENVFILFDKVWILVTKKCDVNFKQGFYKANAVNIL